VHVVEAQHAGADVAADAGVAPASAQMWPISAVVVDLPLVPVMADHLRALVLGRGVDRAREELDVADDLDALGLAFSTVQCGLGWVSGTPGDSIRAAKSTSRRRSGR
jgi:hypothetical protein